MTARLNPVAGTALRADASWWSSTWLGRQPPSFADALLAEAGHRRLDAGDVVVPAHDVECGLVGVVAGSTDIRLLSPDGARHLVSVRQAEHWCGRCEFVPLTPLDLVVTAREAVQLIYLPAERVRRLVLEHPAAPAAFGDLVGEEARWLTTMLDAATERRAVARVARKLLAAFGPDDRSSLRLTQDELAEMTTLSRSTVNRILADFENKGAISAGYGRLAIADRARLRRAAGLTGDATRSAGPRR
jgi:CRP-like cAMP-binding protein